MLDQKVLSVLEEQLSTLTARTLLQRCTAAMGIRPSQLQTQHLPELIRRLEVGVRLFVPAHLQQGLLDRIRALGGPKPKELSVPIESEADIARVRSAAREMALDLTASTFVAQKIVTAVSELARNIALYAGSGEVHLIPIESPEPKLKIVAADHGPGIADPQRVFSGEYKSKTGLGRGLLSLRRMADDFDLKTSADGTTVQVEFVL